MDFSVFYRSFQKGTGECVSVSVATGKGLFRECTPIGAHQYDSEEQRGCVYLLPGTPQGGT